MIPWNVECTFWIDPDHKAPHWTVLPDDCSATYEYWGGLATAPACNIVFRALNMDHSGWRAAARGLLDGPLALDAMLAKIDQYVAFIGDEARAEATPTMYGAFDDSVEYLKGTIPELRDRLEELIREP
ncbi:MAG: hypothetical protein JW940_04405 [Polyangiaceae bacterium]|nr:hypothetical protein [Polyangiaceae bacterium]